MARTIGTIDELQCYLAGVASRAQHHAPNADGVFLALAGAVVLCKDRDQDLEVFETKGDTGNVLWMFKGGRRFAFSFNHNTGHIDVRQDSTQGATVYSFSNADSHDTIYGRISSL